MKKLLSICVLFITVVLTLNASDTTFKSEKRTFDTHSSASCIESVLVDCNGDGVIDYGANVDCKYAKALGCQYMHSCNSQLTNEADCGGNNQ